MTWQAENPNASVQSELAFLAMQTALANQGKLLKLQIGLAKVAVGAESCGIAMVADSTGLGAYSTNSTTSGWFKSQSYPEYFKQLLIAAGIPAETDSLFGTSNATSYYPNLDTKVSVGSGWFGSTSPAVLGGPHWANTTNTNALSLTPEYTTDSVDVWYINNSAYGPFTIEGGGMTPQTITPAGSSTAITKATFTTANGIVRGANTYSIKRVSGSVRVQGLHAYDSQTARAAIYNMGWSGATSTDWNTATIKAGLIALAPVHTHFNLTINDATDSGGNPTVPLPTSEANMRALLAAAATVGSVSLQVPVPASAARTPLQRQAVWGEMLKSVAASYNAPVLDMPAAWISFVDAYNGGIRNGMYGDADVHPWKAGYNSNGRLLYKLLLGK